MTTTHLDLAAIEAAAKAATPGPWVALEIAGYWDIQEKSREGYEAVDVCNDAHPRKQENAAHIAAADPTTVLRLVAIARAARIVSDHLGLDESEYDADVALVKALEGITDGK